MSIPFAAQVLLTFIRETETGRTNASAYDTNFGHNEGDLKKPLTSMTIDEVIAAGPGWTRDYKSSAAGAYQFMNATLKDLKRALNLTGHEKMIPEFQDFLGFKLLQRRDWNRFSDGRIGPVAFAKQLAMEWASFPVLKATKGAHRNLKRGQSYYAGDPLNKALVTPEQVEQVLANVRAILDGDVRHEAPPSPKPTTPAPAPRKSAKGGIIVLVLAALAGIGAFWGNLIDKIQTLFGG